ncbi:MAG: alkaline phosphatase family protein [Thermoleophilaceae bacterium]|nr:alkaline phosphatase family protein [Thermoleophilaceae bacterium]
MADASRQAIVLLADGARADVFARMLAAGELPEIENHVLCRGGHRTATSTFTSTTIPAHLPFLTGRFAGSADVPGYRWFDHRKQPRHAPLGPWSFRSYNGIESINVDRDIAADAPTLFELAPGSQNIFGAITRGLGRGGNLAATRKNFLWLKAHYREDYRVADDAARKVLARSLDKHAPFRFVVIPGIDWNSHYDDPFGEGAYEAYRRVDRTVGEIARKLDRLGRYEDTLLAVVSDHGHEPVREHFDLGPRMAEDLGLKVAYHSLKAWRFKPDALCAVSGNAMAHLYLNTVVPELTDWLLAEPAVDIVASREHDGSVLVESRRGRARLAETERGLAYRPIAGDPFGYGALPEEFDFETALTATAGTEHPDGLLQLAQIFRSARTGDVVVSGAPGYDLRKQYERPEHRSSHGALHASHMNVPLAISAPIAEGPVRTADVFSMVLEHLGIASPPGVDGRSRLLDAAQPSVEPALAPSS